jgi:hypothetical protein
MQSIGVSSQVRRPKVAYAPSPLLASLAGEESRANAFAMGEVKRAIEIAT